LVRGLYERDWSAADVRQLFRVIDWLMALPTELQVHFRQELYAHELEKRMPYLSSIERMAMEEGHEKGLQEGRQEGLLMALEAQLESKFGDAGLKLMARLRSVKDLEKLQALARAVVNAHSVAELRRLLR
jgi:hypothetical protein